MYYQITRQETHSLDGDFGFIEIIDYGDSLYTICGRIEDFNFRKDFYTAEESMEWIEGCGFKTIFDVFVKIEDGEFVFIKDEEPHNWVKEGF